MALLEIEAVHSYYGQIHALKGLSLSVEKGEVVTLIGANGAGKSTTLRTISGLVRSRQGTIKLGGERIDHLEPHKVVEAGIGHVPEGRGIFPRLTVMENLEIGAYTLADAKELNRRMGHVFETFPRLKERINQLGGTLSGGEQQMLAMGRALIARPTVMLLDEPSMGLSPLLVEQIFRTIKELNEQGTTILLVEQNARMALSIAHMGYVIQTGEIILHDTAEKLKENEMVQKSYLGEI